VFPPGKFSRTPILCYVTDRKSLPTKIAPDNFAPLLEQIAAAASADVNWVQIREKDLSAKELSSLTRAAVAQTKQINERNRTLTRIIVNDRLDVAQSEGGGVHLGEHSLPVHDVCKWLAAKPNFAEGDKFLVGASCHSVQSVASAAHDGADYIFFGPVFATPSKARFGAPQGLQRLAEACNCVSIPVIAIGGITVDNACDCFAAGAGGIAAIRLFQDAGNLASLVSCLRAGTR
jgi:thiamine-phosphate pyrophosphorylase